MITFVLRGVERLQGEYDGRPFDTFRFNFSSKSKSGFGSIPYVTGGKLPSIKYEEMPDFFDEKFDADKPDFGLSEFLGHSFHFFTDKYGRIQFLQEVS